jgi:hypothetical protein
MGFLAANNFILQLELVAWNKFFASFLAMYFVWRVRGLNDLRLSLRAERISGD